MGSNRIKKKSYGININSFINMKRGKAFPLVYVTWVKSVEGRSLGER